MNKLVRRPGRVTRIIYNTAAFYKLRFIELDLCFYYDLICTGGH